MENGILFQKEARDRLLRGAELLMESVKGTLGPCGHHVVIQKKRDCLVLRMTESALPNL